jgi:hypothetical protein
METIRAELVVRFDEVARGKHVLNVTAGPDGIPVILALAEKPDYRTRDGCFPKREASRPQRFSVYRLSPSGWSETALEPTRVNYPHVQPLSDGWLLVCSRSSPEGGRNAWVYTEKGSVRSAFAAGDGIEDVQVDPADRIWVSYFDEGVFSGIEPGPAGVARFDSDGSITFRYAQQAGEENLADCYAMNVCSEREAWIRYYTDFPLVRLRDDRVAGRWEDLPARGCKAFAVGGFRVLFSGGYDEDGVVHAVDLASGGQSAWRVADDAGTLLVKAKVFGRRDWLYFWNERGLFRLSGYAPQL